MPRSSDQEAAQLSIRMVCCGIAEPHCGAYYSYPTCRNDPNAERRRRHIADTGEKTTCPSQIIKELGGNRLVVITFRNNGKASAPNRTHVDLVNRSIVRPTVACQWSPNPHISLHNATYTCFDKLCSFTDSLWRFLSRSLKLTRNQCCQYTFNYVRTSIIQSVLK